MYIPIPIFTWITRGGGGRYGGRARLSVGLGCSLAFEASCKSRTGLARERLLLMQGLSRQGCPHRELVAGAWRDEYLISMPGT